MWADLINGAFEALASLFILNHCRVMYAAKTSEGISAVSTAFFTAWGFWNIVYYWHIGQPLSWWGGIAVVSANALWLGMQLYYKRVRV